MNTNTIDIRYNSRHSDEGFDFVAYPSAVNVKHSAATLRRWVLDEMHYPYAKVCEEEYDLQTIGLDGIAA